MYTFVKKWFDLIYLPTYLVVPSSTNLVEPSRTYTSESSDSSNISNSSDSRDSNDSSDNSVSSDSSDSSERGDWWTRRKISTDKICQTKKKFGEKKKLSLWPNSKTQVVTRLNNSNYDKTQKLNLWQNSNCDNSKLWQNSKTQILKTKKNKLWLNPNCEKTKNLNC